MCGHEGEILLDLSKSGKERPWKKHKTNSQLLSESFKRIDKHSKGVNVESCGSHLKFNVCPSGHERKLTWANFCRVRLCPMCSWRRSLLIAHQLKEVAHETVQRKPVRWLFLTLTVKNCDAADLQDTLSYMMKSWERLSRRKPFKNAVLGWFRGLEITRNTFEDTYHPHFHILLAVEPSYFTNKDKYLTKDDWADLWQKSLKVDYQPIVDIRRVKNKRDVSKEMAILEQKGVGIGEDGIISESELAGSAVAELAKYATKADDFLVYKEYRKKQEGKKVVLYPDLNSGLDEIKTDEVVNVLDSGLSRRRLVAYGGLLKEIWNELQEKGKVQDAEDDNADLVHVDGETNCKCSVCGSDMLEELYSWLPNLKNYVKKE